MNAIEQRYMEAVTRNLPALTSVLQGKQLSEIAAAIKENTEAVRENTEINRKVLERLQRLEQTAAGRVPAGEPPTLSVADSNIVESCRPKVILSLLGISPEAEIPWRDVRRKIAEMSSDQRAEFFSRVFRRESNPESHPGIDTNLGLTSGNVWLNDKLSGEQTEELMIMDQQTAMKIYGPLIPSTDDYLELTRECEMQWYAGLKKWCFKKGEKKLFIRPGVYWTNVPGRAVKFGNAENDAMSIISLEEGQSEKILLSACTKIRTVTVEWDTDGEENADLPETVKVSGRISDEQMSDYLSDTYGFCVKSWYE